MRGDGYVVSGFWTDPDCKDRSPDISTELHAILKFMGARCHWQIDDNRLASVAKVGK